MCNVIHNNRYYYEMLVQLKGGIGQIQILQIYPRQTITASMETSRLGRIISKHSSRNVPKFIVRHLLKDFVANYNGYFAAIPVKINKSECEEIVYKFNVMKEWESQRNKAEIKRNYKEVIDILASDKVWVWILHVGLQKMVSEGSFSNVKDTNRKYYVEAIIELDEYIKELLYNE
eukprot:TRINITY_DN2251_c0_g1_i1.p5 TRINITY_DN2251_c0_g1~~TRINITY_DN2251_c0_g1_i1.p5  ORF type:complete len:175 (-),score=17.45 TRINITY_DN2251_c0_g1_i1:1697-2221(-)